MKKVKIMLTAIGVLAVVGGAVAFKAKKFSSFSYCVTTITDGTGICTVLVTDKAFSKATPVTLSYRRINNGGTCSGSNTACTTGGSALID